MPRGKPIKSKWYPFDMTRGSRQMRPPIKKYVLVLLRTTRPGYVPNRICVGYRKDGAGDPQSPYFVTPGAGRTSDPRQRDVIAWCDCLPDDFTWPKEYKEPDHA